MLRKDFYPSPLFMVLAAMLHFLGMLQSKAHAQNAVDNAARQAEQLERDWAADERQRQVERGQLNNQSPNGPRALPPHTDIAASDEACTQVNAVSVTGVTLLQTQVIQGVTTAYEGKCLGIADINNILKQLTFLYVEKGYITSRAFLPEQDLADGALEIVVLEGKMESIVIDDSPDRHKNQIRTAFPDMVGKPVNLRDIEQGLDQLNRLRSNDATIVLEAGKEAGSSVLSVSRRKRKNWYATISSDNLGALSTGEYQSRIDLEFEDVLRLNEQWRFGYQQSMDSHPWYFAGVPNSSTYTGSFSIPYGYWSFAIEGSWSQYNSQIAGAITVLGTSGLSQSVSMRVSRMMHRNQTSTTSLAGKLKWKRTENFILANRLDVSSRDLSIGTVELTHSRQLWEGQLVVSTSYQQGLKILGAFDDDTAPAGSPKGQFRGINLSLGYLKPFKLVNLAATYNGQLTGQYSSDLLFGSEQAAYGGHSTVRGLRESVVFGNSGIMMRNEFSLQLPQFDSAQFVTLLGTFEAYTAIDFGHVFAEDAFEISSGNLTGATIGLRSRGNRISFDVS